MSLVFRSNLGRKLTISEMDGNFQYIVAKVEALDETNLVKPIDRGGYISLVETSDTLYFLENMHFHSFGSTVSGNQMFTANLDDLAISSKFTIIQENGSPFCIDLVIGTSRSATSLQHYDPNDVGRWRSSMSAESFEHSCKGLISVGIATTSENSKCEMEFYDQDKPGHKSNINIFLDRVTMDSFSPTYSMSFYLSNSGMIKLGNINEDMNSTILEIDDNLETIKLNSVNLSVNGEVGVSGTYSTVDSIITVTNGLITGIVPL